MSEDDFWDHVVGKKKEEKKELQTVAPQQPQTNNPFLSDQTEQHQQPKEKEEGGSKGVDKAPPTPTPQITDPFETEGNVGETAVVPKALEAPSAVNNLQGVSTPTEPREIKSPASPPSNDPFAEKTGDVVETPVVSTSETSAAVSQPPAPSPSDEPFPQSTSPKEEFSKQKPATTGKNLSSMIFGKKGTGKTVAGLSFPGRIFAISLDQQTAIIHEDFYHKDPRIEVWDGIEFYNSKDPETKLNTATKTVEYINWLLENPCKKFQPDWILIDGTERLSHVCEMAMRAQENLLPYEGVKNRNAWKYRNDLINNIHQRAVQIAKLGVIYTAYTEIETVTTATGEEHREGPKWAGDIEQKTQIVIKTSSVPIQNGRAFIAEVESSKVSYIPTGRKVVIGERINSGEMQNYIGIKAIFTPEGSKKYFSNGGD